MQAKECTKTKDTAETIPSSRRICFLDQADALDAIEDMATRSWALGERIMGI